MIRAASIATVVLLLSGCGGGAPAVSTIPNPSAHAPQDAERGAAAPAGTLYVATLGFVSAFALDASGTASAARTITPHPNQSQIIVRIAAGTDGTLGISENLFTGTGNNQHEYCRLVVEPADANGSPPAATYYPDGTDTGQCLGIARNASGGFDLASLDTTTAKDILHRFGSDGGTPINTLVLAHPGGLATDRGGHDYLDDNTNQIVIYKSSTTDPATTVAAYTLSGVTFLGATAVSPGADRTLYVVARAGTDSYIYAIANGATTPSRSIGPFAASSISINALAVDSQGELYAAFHPSSGNDFIRVYDANADGKPAPLRRIDPSPAIVPIKAIAVFE